MKQPDPRRDYNTRAAVAMLLDDVRHALGLGVDRKRVQMVLRQARESVQHLALERDVQEQAR